jgi:hypothetical protein
MALDFDRFVQDHFFEIEALEDEMLRGGEGGRGDKSQPLMLILTLFQR